MEGSINSQLFNSPYLRQAWSCYKSADVLEEHSDEGCMETPVWVAISGIFSQLGNTLMVMAYFK